MNNNLKRIAEISDELKNTTDPAKKEELRNEFWKVAIDEFNENVAGTVVTVHGVVLYTPEIEIEI